MNFLRQVFLTLSFTTGLITSFSSPSLANPLCNRTPFENIVAAGVSEANRYTEVAVSYLCENEVEKVEELVDTGYITRSDAYILADYFGIRFEAETRSLEGRLYKLVYRELLGMGLCTACASNAALEYVDSPDSYMGRLVERSLEGDEYATELLMNYNYEEGNEKP